MTIGTSGAEDAVTSLATRIQSRTRAMIGEQELRRQDDRGYLRQVVAEARHILDSHRPGAAIACTVCGEQWPCARVRMISSPRYWID